MSNMLAPNEKIYCSLDIETSGFDPFTNEILEVGFAFFKVGKKGLEIVEEWTQVFKPTKPVSPQILGLTGITLNELEQAQDFKEHRDFIQTKLGDAIIVGHNVIFDIKFLESFGIKFNGLVIDTLDLAQFILPTHHSYNLENLMHTFSIKHTEAHRALADSKAAIKLLEKLLKVYVGFPEELKQKIHKIISKQGFVWEEFLNVSFKPEIFENFASFSKIKLKKDLSFKVEPKTFYNFGISQNVLSISDQINKEEKTLLVVPKAYVALDLYKKKKVDAAAFLPEQMFDGKKFNKFFKKNNLTTEEVKFLLKVLVWQYTNWQTETFLDLNLSFFGGQFKNLISGKEIKENKTAKVVCTDINTFFSLSQKELYRNRKVIIFGLNEFENAITANIGSKTSWGYINYLLRTFYNPEFATGNADLKEVVEEALSAGDLFFGLVNAFYQTDPPTFQYIKISETFVGNENYSKLQKAAANYVEKIEKTNLALKSNEVEIFINNLKKFFQNEINRVKWIELSENRCAFISMPLNITELVKEVLSPYVSVSFADSSEPKILPNFFLRRLGLNDFKIKEGKQMTTSVQGDLFTGLKKVFGKGVNFHFVEQTVKNEEIYRIISSSKNLPAAVLFPGQSQVKEFYELHYAQLKKQTTLFAQMASGGTNKIFRNFSINNNGLLLATDKLILKHLNNLSAVDPVGNLPVKTLVICRLPFEQFTHPYQEALSQSLPNAFEDYSLPRALYNFHSLIKFFYTPQLRDIYIIDAKLAKPYAKIFKEYEKSII